MPSLPNGRDGGFLAALPINMSAEKSTNVKWHDSNITRGTRQALLKQKGCTLWLTGLSASGKSTIAFALEENLIYTGHPTYVLDGDNVRHGLNGNLGFSPEDRTENIRRISEVSKLFADSGMISITSFISPYKEDRDKARQIHDEVGLPFFEIFIHAPVLVCESRDPKGLYKKAHEGEIAEFTGVNAPYEKPNDPDLYLRTDYLSVEQSVRELMNLLRQNGII